MSIVLQLKMMGRVAALSVLLAAPSWASVSFERVTWGTGGTVLGWAVPPPEGDAISLTAPATGGSLDDLGFLAMDFSAANPSTQQADRMANGGAGYTGNYIQDKVGGVTFDLKGYSGSTLQLYFVSSADGGSTWWWDLDAPVVDQEWQNYRVNFRDQGINGWHTSGSMDFINALSQVESIGLIVGHYGTDMPMQYGLDNWQFQLAVPEPETTSMAAVIGLSALVWVRRMRRTRTV
jgi:hypothetical protein